MGGIRLGEKTELFPQLTSILSLISQLHDIKRRENNYLVIFQLQLCFPKLTANNVHVGSTWMQMCQLTVAHLVAKTARWSLFSIQILYFITSSPLLLLAWKSTRRWDTSHAVSVPERQLKNQRESLILSPN